MKDKENLMDELLTKAQRQSALRGELLQRHDALVREVAEADVYKLSQQYNTFRHYVVAVCFALALVLPVGLFVNSRMPSEAIASAGYNRAQAIHTVTLIIS